MFEAGDANDEKISAECCDNPIAGTIKECVLCGVNICKGCRKILNGQKVCLPCRDKIEAEIALENYTPQDLPKGIAGGLAGAIAGAIIWTVIIIVTGFEIGYLAIGLGYLAGKSVDFFVGGKKGFPLQIVAIVSSVFGLAISKVMYLSYSISLLSEESPDEAISMFDSDALMFSIKNIGLTLEPFDLLWCGLAIAAAWGVSKPNEIRYN